jgi:transposase
VAAATLVAELGDIARFTNPRQLMAYLGLVPSEHSSGRTRRQGGITKAGNGAARRMLIEAAWSYRFPARIARDQLLRQERLAKPVIRRAERDHLMLYLRTKERPDRLRPEIRIDRNKSERDGIMSRVCCATEILGRIR